MTLMKEKLIEAMNVKNNDIKSFVWKFPRKSDGTQEEIKLIDATPDQLQQFYNHCWSMLYSNNKKNPGRYTLLDIIKDQRNKCNVELFLRRLEDGSLCMDHKPYPRYLYIQDINTYMDAHKEDFPKDKRNQISISSFSGSLPREFERISVTQVLAACMDQLGEFDNKHITFSFILSLGLHLTSAEMKEFTEVDKDGNPRSKLEIVKEKLNIKPNIMLSVKNTGLSFAEFRAMLNLKPKKYSELTTDQLTTLRNKVLFRLENEVQYHISQWEERISQLKKVADSKNITLNDPR